MSSRFATRNFIVVISAVLALGLILVLIPIWRSHEMVRQSRFNHLILLAAGETGCDPHLVKAVVWRETRFNPKTKGRSGEIGLMQIMPSVAAEWAAAHGIKDFPLNALWDPLTNLRVGSWYLAKSIQQWNQATEPIPLALAQYNAGRSNVLKWVDVNSMADPETFIARIQFPSTRTYVRAIYKQFQRYQQRGEF